MSNKIVLECVEKTIIKTIAFTLPNIKIGVR